MKEINLEEILKDNCVNIGYLKQSFPNDGILESEGIRILKSMLEVCRQVLELANENAKIEIKTVGEELIITDIHQEDNYTRIQINAASILNTINQVK